MEEGDKQKSVEDPSTHAKQCTAIKFKVPFYPRIRPKRQEQKSSSSLHEPETEKNDEQKSVDDSVKKCLSSLVHATTCRSGKECSRATCYKMKKMIQHTKHCKRRQAAASNCAVCRQLVALCAYHAKQCTEIKCMVPFCAQIRQKLQEQESSSSFHEPETEKGDEQKSVDPSAVARNDSVKKCLSSLLHAITCRSGKECSRATCYKMKKVIQHTKRCKRRQAAASNCAVCRQLVALCAYHAKQCTEIKCMVPFCAQIRQKLQEQESSS